MARKDSRQRPGGKSSGRPRQGNPARSTAAKHSTATRDNPRHAGHPAAEPHGKARQADLSPRSRNGFFLYGRHAVEAALKNRNRECVRLIGTSKVLKASGLAGIRPALSVETVEDDMVFRSAVPADAPHQGILLEVRPLPGLDLMDLAPRAGSKNIILMLDQVTDPHNVGACLRSAAALGARALITQDRNSPMESGVLARAAAGGLELLPWLRIANLAQGLDTLKELGYWHVGLDGHTDDDIGALQLGDNIVLVMGSEGKGLRPLVRKHCDAIARIPMSGSMESLNVSNAAAIALYEFSRP